MNTEINNLINFPNLIIAGVAHGGTTSLFTYLSSHPEICASKIKETHYFRPIIGGGNLAPIQEYHFFFQHHQNEQYIMESGPGYLFGGRKLATLLKEMLGEIKLLFILREPVARLYSCFKHSSKSLVIENISFHEFVESLSGQLHGPEFHKLQDSEAQVATGLDSGYYERYLQEWYTVFEEQSMKVVFFDDLKEKPHELVKDIYQWLSIDSCSTTVYTQENKGFYYKNKFIHKLAINFNAKFEPFFRTYPALKLILKKIYMLNAQENPFPLDDTTKEYLKKLYAPQNNKLYSLLISKG
ncbi:MAG: hypothetical protein D3906_12625, partial [Candidatus Electrothrix sp. AUS1_2]|nr:hypothetical protein [Candidatus Electrothrix sp. AUS1_2]